MTVTVAEEFRGLRIYRPGYTCRNGSQDVPYLQGSDSQDMKPARRADTSSSGVKQLTFG